MGDQVVPALTSQEWGVAKKVEDGDGEVWVRKLSLHAGSGPCLVVSDGGEESCVVHENLLAATMALANDTLPAGHPLKITADDVADLRVCWDAVDMNFPDTRAGPRRHYVDGLEAVIKKLAALLPPEERV